MAKKKVEETPKIDLKAVLDERLKKQRELNTKSKKTNSRINLR